MISCMIDGHIVFSIIWLLPLANAKEFCTKCLWTTYTDYYRILLLFSKLYRFQVWIDKFEINLTTLLLTFWHMLQFKAVLIETYTFTVWNCILNALPEKLHNFQMNRKFNVRLQQANIRSIVSIAKQLKLVLILVREYHLL